MTAFRTTALAFAVAMTLAACGRDEARGTGDDATAIERNVESNVETAMDEARRELATGNISLDATGQPDAEITPQGDLLIDGKAVPVTAAQRAQLVDYRAQLAGVAAAGMDVGKQGAKLAARAVGEAVRGIFSGKPDDIEQRVEAQAEPIRQAALKLCDRLPGLYQSQQSLAASLPAFKPYATMDLDDVEDCRKDVMDGKPPTPPAPPAPPSPPDAPAKGNAAGSAATTASEVIGKPELPEPPELPDATG